MVAFDLSVRVSVCPSIHPSVRQSVRPSVHPSIHPSIHLYLSIYHVMLLDCLRFAFKCDSLLPTKFLHPLTHTFCAFRSTVLAPKHLETDS